MNPKENIDDSFNQEDVLNNEDNDAIVIVNVNKAPLPKSFKNETKPPSLGEMLFQKSIINIDPDSDNEKPYTSLNENDDDLLSQKINQPLIWLPIIRYNVQQIKEFIEKIFLKLSDSSNLETDDVLKILTKIDKKSEEPNFDRPELVNLIEKIESQTKNDTKSKVRISGDQLPPQKNPVPTIRPQFPFLSRIPAARRSNAQSIANARLRQDRTVDQQIRQAGDELKVDADVGMVSFYASYFAVVYIRVLALRNGLFMLYVGRSGGQSSTGAGRTGAETAAIRRDLGKLEADPNFNDFEFNCKTYLYGAFSRLPEIIDNLIIDGIPVELILFSQFYLPSISEWQVEAQETFAIETVMQSGTVFGRPLWQLIREQVSAVSPDWFRPDSKYVVCNVNSLPLGWSNELSVELAQELINATPEQIANLSQEQINRIYRENVRTLDELLT